MYLNTVLPLILVLKALSCLADCGCKLNRNGQCNIDNPSEKYSKDLNDLKLDNNILPNDDLSTDNMVLIDGGTFEMGTNKPVFESDHEGPVRNATVKSFYLDKYEVSNQNFKDFVQQTGYKTEAEVFGDSFVFEMILPEDQRKEYQDVRAVQAPWWIKLKGVTWKQPEGEKSSIEGKLLVIDTQTK